MIELTILGTACMMPTKERNHTSILLTYKGDSLLFDCGENTQRQLKIAGISAPKIKHIFISHWHGDHVLGIPGLLQSLAASDYNGTLKIYGPKGTKEKILKLMDVFEAEEGNLPLEIKDILTEGVILDLENYSVKAYSLEHNIPTYGFRFEEKDKRKMIESEIKKLGIPNGPLLGKLQSGESIDFNGKTINPDDVSNLIKGRSIGFIMDTVICNGALKLAKNNDLLISEASYLSEHFDKSEQYKHMTAEQAAQIANQAGAKKLVLTHFSQRYKSTNGFLEEAQKIFDNVVIAYDFMKIKV